jgi:hypothetical protein
MSNSVESYAAIVGMTEEEAMQSEKYRALREAGADHESALQTIGEGVFLRTLATTAVIAGLASKATGVAGFEGNLFTRGKVGSLPGRTPWGKLSNRGKTIRAAQRTGRLTADATRFVGPAATKEFFEESIQSGGGAYLSQSAQAKVALSASCPVA